MLRLAVALWIGLVGSASAQVTAALDPARPKLRPLVVVNSDLVRVGDLIENAGPAAAVPVFRAPDLGHTGGVPINRLLEAVSPYRIAFLDTGGISEVVVTRLSRAITQKEIETRIARVLAGHHGFGEARNIAVTLERDMRTIHVEPSATGELVVTRLNVEPRTGRFQIAFDLPGSAVARRLALRFSGIAVETVEAPVLVRAFNRGEVIKASDLALERRPRAELSGDFLNAAAIAGFAARRPLPAGVVVRRGDLMKPELIQRNEPVTIAYEVPGVLLTARGKALEAGAAGDIISVLNLQSNRTIQGTVTGTGRVNVSAGHRPSASTTPDSSVAPPNNE